MTRISFKTLHRISVLMTILAAMAQTDIAFAYDQSQIADAYRSIPARRIAYNAETSKMSDKDKVYFKALFKLTDEAIIEKTTMMKYMQSGGQRGIAYPEYDKAFETIQMSMQNLEAPRHLKGVHQAVIEILAEQTYFFKTWYANYDNQRRMNIKNKSVKRIHRLVEQTNETLKTKYRAETLKNRQALEAHLNALDFISRR